MGQENLSRGASLRGQGTPADPARLRSVRAETRENLDAAGRAGVQSMDAADFCLLPRIVLKGNGGVASPVAENLFLLIAAQELVAFDSGDDTNGALIARLRALYAAEAANTHRSGEGNFIRQGQQNLHGGAFLDVFGQEKVHTPGADIAGFRTGFSNGCTCGPADRERQPHGKPLRRAAFGSRQDALPPDGQSVAGVQLANNRTGGTKAAGSGKVRKY
jgi:hypothetical protein